MQAVILAGGLGTRLRPILSHRPKSMADFGAKPFLEYQVEWLRGFGIGEILLCVGHLHEQIQSWFGDGSRWDMRIRYSVEPSPLGTGGALRLARPHLRETFLLLNGDSYLELDLADFVDCHRRARLADGRCLGTLALARVPDASAYAAVSIDAGRRILAYAEKAQAASAWISAGIYALEAAILDGVPAGRALGLERDVLPAALGSGHLYGYPADGFFVDIGTPQGCRTFANHLEAARHDPAQ